MSTLVEFISQSTLAKATLYIGIIYFLRQITESIVRTSSRLHWTQDQRLKIVGHIRSIAFPLLVVVGVIWLGLHELQSVVSIFAASVAFVIALKELILCLHGYVILVTSYVYQLGDRIELQTMRGDVVNINVFTTTLMEVGTSAGGHQRTGRQISFPNSLLLNYSVANESFVDNFALLMLRVPMSAAEDWARAKSLLLEIAQDECAPFLEKARRRAGERARRQGIDFPAVDPQVNLQLEGPQLLALVLRVACPLHLRDQIEQSILTRFLKGFALSGQKVPTQFLELPSKTASPGVKSRGETGFQ